MAVQLASGSGAHALIPSIADTKFRGPGHNEVLAHNFYDSDENHRAAATAEVALIAPTSKSGKRAPYRISPQCDRQRHSLLWGSGPQGTQVQKEREMQGSI